jgi:hypothetical protein
MSQSRVSIAEAQEQFVNPEEGKRPPLEAVTGRLVKSATETIKLYLIVIYKL